MKQRFGKRDIIFIFVLLALGIGSWLYVDFFLAKTGEIVLITVDSVEYGRYSLHENKTIPIQIEGKTKNVVQIQDGKASVSEADCPDKLCVYQNAISLTNESIVCLPNKVVVMIIGGTQTSYDTIAQ